MLPTGTQTALRSPVSTPSWRVSSAHATTASRNPAAGSGPWQEGVGRAPQVEGEQEDPGRRGDQQRAARVGAPDQGAGGRPGDRHEPCQRPHQGDRGQPRQQFHRRDGGRAVADRLLGVVAGRRHPEAEPEHGRDPRVDHQGVRVAQQRGPPRRTGRDRSRRCAGDGRCRCQPRDRIAFRRACRARRTTAYPRVRARSGAYARVSARHSSSRPNSSGPVERRTVTRRSAYGPWARRAGTLPTASDWAYPAARTALPHPPVGVAERVGERGRAARRVRQPTSSRQYASSVARRPGGELVELRVGVAVAADLHSGGGQFAHLPPVEHPVRGAPGLVEPPQPAGGDEHRCGQRQFGQDRQGVPVHPLVAVVEGDEDRPGRQRAAGAPPGGELGGGERGAAVRRHHRHLLGEGVRGHRECPRRGGGGAGDGVVHQDRHRLVLRSPRPAARLPGGRTRRPLPQGPAAGRVPAEQVAAHDRARGVPSAASVAGEIPGMRGTAKEGASARRARQEPAR